MAAIRFLDKPVLKLEIILGLAWARFLIRFVPFRWWRGTLGPLKAVDDVPQGAILDDAQAATAAGIGRVIRKIAREMPFKAVCLPQAMTARWMLQRRSIPSRIVIGSRRGVEGEEDLLFHAWLLAGGNAVTGGEENGDFNEFSRLASSE